VQLEDQEKIPTMVAVLAGLAENTGLKEFFVRNRFWKPTQCHGLDQYASKNTSITILDLHVG
jgi:hypothetical protein